MRKKPWIRLCCLCLIAFNLFGSMAASAQGLADIKVTSAELVKDSTPENGMVRVYLSSLGSPSKLNLTTSGVYYINGQRSKSIASGSSVTVSFNSYSGLITLNAAGKQYNVGDYCILQRTGIDQSNYVKIAQARESQNPYPGDISFRAVRSGSSYKLQVVAHVYIENYLYGVLPYEMGNSSSIEALKAQAVAARTYTVRMMKSRASGNYDVTDTSSDQVYRGTPGGNQNCVAAVDATKGIVLKYKGEYITTYYSASNGGQTETPANTTGSSSYPYLKVKDDPFDFANPSSLVKSKQIYANLQSGSNPSNLVSLLKNKAVPALKAAGYNATVYNTSLLSISSISPHTPKYKSPSRLYTKMDFVLSVRTGNNGVKANVTVTLDIFSELEGMLSMSIQSSNSELWSVRKNGNGFVLEARRYGHGYGMSQRGAMYMGQLGYTYDQILGFYFTGCTRVRKSFTNKVLEQITVEEPVEIPDEASGECIGTVSLVSNSSREYIRKKRMKDAAILCELSSGARVKVIHKNSKWCFVSYGAIKGYVPTESLQITGTPDGEAGTATEIQGFCKVVCNGSVNLRKNPSLNAEKLSTAKNGEVLTVFSVANGWAHVQYQHIEAYVSTDFISAVSKTYPSKAESTQNPSSDAVVITDSGTGTVNLRSAASTSAAVLIKIPVYERITVLSDDGAWARLLYQNTEGYMMSRYISYNPEDFTPPPSPEATPTPEATPAPAEPPEDESSDPTEGENEKMQYALVTTASGSLNLRVSPMSGSRILTTIPQYAVVEVPYYGEVWSSVIYNGYTGYSMSQFLTLRDSDTPEQTPDSPPEQTPAPPSDPEENTYAVVTTVSGSLNLREAPINGARILCTIPRFAAVEVNSRQSRWCGVTFAGVSGYVMTEFLTFTDEETDIPAASQPKPPQTPSEAKWQAVVVTPGGSLNLRESPVSGAAIITRIPEKARIDVLEKGALWCRVRYHFVEGYVMTSFLSFDSAQNTTPEPTPAPEDSAPENIPEADVIGKAWVLTPSGSLNLRMSPSANAAVIAQIPRSTEVSLLEKGSQWCMVYYQGLSGYVMTSFLSFDKLPEPTPAPEKNEEPEEETETSLPLNPQGNIQVLGEKKNALLVPAQGEVCYLYADCSTESLAVATLLEDTPVLVWMYGEDWCLVQFDLSDAAALGYCRTKDLFIGE